MSKGYRIKSSNGLYFVRYGNRNGLSRNDFTLLPNKKFAAKVLTQVKKFFSTDLTYSVEAI